jgi:hypothetical protein
MKLLYRECLNQFLSKKNFTIIFLSDSIEELYTRGIKTQSSSKKTIPALLKQDKYSLSSFPSAHHSTINSSELSLPLRYFSMLFAISISAL